MRESIASLKELRALVFPVLVMHDAYERSLSLAPHLTRLTELSISLKGSLVSDLGCLVNLVNLELHVYPEVACHLNDTLIQMPYLENVSVRRTAAFDHYNHKKAVQPKQLSIFGSALRESKRLKSLHLDSVTVNEFFFQELASTARLTKLEFESTEEEVCVQSFVDQIHMLEYLEELKLTLGDRGRVCDLLSPQYFPRLSKLIVPSSPEETETLRRRFACRPQVLVNRIKISRWCSQFTT